MKDKEIKKIVLAYSGGLDTSVAIKWLQEKYNAEIIAYAADVGQGVDREALEKKAMATGATSVYIEDLTEEFVESYVFPSLQAGAKYEGKYPLATALSRPLIAARMVEIAQREGADAVAHGCTGKGNDQVRFDVTFRALAPELEIIAPLRVWDFTSRNQEIEYAREHGIEVEATADSPYSYDRNLWGVSIECGPLEDPWNAPPEDIYLLTTDPRQAPDEPEEIVVEFEAGKPVALAGEKMDLVSLIDKLNRLAGKHGVGRIDMVENRLVGLKSREVYEAPAGVILHKAHRALMDLTLERDLYHYLQRVSLKYAELVYNAQWFSPLRESLDALIERAQADLDGEVRIRLYKGQATVRGRRSDKSLYDYGLATYDEDDEFDQSLSEGFVELWGLPLKVVGEQRQ